MTFFYPSPYTHSSLHPLSSSCTPPSLLSLVLSLYFLSSTVSLPSLWPPSFSLSISLSFSLSLCQTVLSVILYFPLPTFFSSVLTLCRLQWWQWLRSVGGQQKKVVGWGTQRSNVCVCVCVLVGACVIPPIHQSVPLPVAPVLGDGVEFTRVWGHLTVTFNSLTRNTNKHVKYPLGMFL